MNGIYKILSAILVLAFLLGCSRGPTKDELIGSWDSEDGGYLKLYNSGSLTTNKLSKDVRTSFSIAGSERQFSGERTWVLEKGSRFQELRLNFKTVDGKMSNGFYVLLVSGSNMLENSPPWYLFVWEEEEGGNRIKFQKVK